MQLENKKGNYFESNIAAKRKPQQEILLKTIRKTWSFEVNQN